MPGIAQQGEAIAQQTTDQLGHHDCAGDEKRNEEVTLMRRDGPLMVYVMDIISFHPLFLGMDMNAPSQWAFYPGFNGGIRRLAQWEKEEELAAGGKPYRPNWLNSITTWPQWMPTPQ